MSYWFICLILFFGLLADAQSFIVKGKVIDGATDELLIGAHVLSMQDWKVGVVTDAQGRFIVQIAEGDSLLVSFIGFEERVIDITDNHDDLRIVLQPSTVQVLGVEVVAERLISEDFVVKKIERLEVYKNPAAKGDLLLAVNVTPSVTTLDESANISFRGSSPAETGVFYNHVPIYDAVRFAQLNGIGTFSIFNTEMVSSIHVFPGNPPLEYGNTSSGLIAIQSRNDVPVFRQTQVNLSLASIGVFHTRDLGEKQNSGLILFGNFQPSQLLKATNGKALEDIEWFQSADLGLQYVYQIDDRSKLRVFNYALSEGYDFNLKSPSYDGLFTQRKLRNFTIANYLRQTRSGVFSVNAGYSLSAQKLDVSRSDYDIRGEDIYLSINYHKSKKRLEWKAGVAYDGRSQDFEGVVPVFGYALREEHPHLTISQTSHRRLFDGYGFLTYRPSKYISFGYALRSNAPIDGQEMRLGRQSVITYTPSQTHQFIWSSGTYHKFNLGSDSDSEWIRTRQQSLDYQLKVGNISSTISGYLKKSERGQVSNDIAGVEVYTKYRLAQRLFADLSYSFIDMRQNQGGQGIPGRYDLNYFVRGGFEWQISSLWSLSTRALFRQGVFFSPVVGANFSADLNVFEPIYAAQNSMERLPRYQIIDINVSRLFSLNEDINGVIFGSISNVLDRKNIRDIGYSRNYLDQTPQFFSRRTVFFGLAIYLQ